MNADAIYQHFILVEKRRENYRTQTLVFDRPLPEAQPGQFVMAWLPGIGEKPFSLANTDPLAVTVTDVGEFSKALCDLSFKGNIWIRGPFGQGFNLQGQRHLIVAGGYGAAPLHLLARLAIERGDDVHVCLGARTARDLLLNDAFRLIGCQVSIATDDGSLGQAGLVTDLIGSIHSDYAAKTLYACGPTPMLAALVQWCRLNKLSAQFSWEAHMRCGIGLCGSCELENETRNIAGLPIGWLACKDGPVSYHQFEHSASVQ